MEAVIEAVAIGFSSSCLFTYLLLRKRGLSIDSPSDRSSHVIPTPRGGGAAIVGGFSCAMLFLVHSQTSLFQLATLLFSLIIGALGISEDRIGVGRGKRLFIQLLASAGLMTVYIFAELGKQTGNETAFAALIPVLLIGILWLVWSMNLFNFMDGINGISTLQAVASSVLLIILGMGFGRSGTGIVGAALLGASLGFLPYNFPKARIFMGDSGSLFLGAILASSMLGADSESVLLGPICAILVSAPFFFDATTTLLRRAWLREHLGNPHRTHLYQRLAIRWQSHVPVTLLYFGVSLLGGWLAWGLLGGWPHSEALATFYVVVLCAIGTVSQISFLNKKPLTH